MLLSKALSYLGNELIVSQECFPLTNFDHHILGKQGITFYGIHLYGTHYKKAVYRKTISIFTVGWESGWYHGQFQPTQQQ